MKSSGAASRKDSQGWKIADGKPRNGKNIISQDKKLQLFGFKRIQVKLLTRSKPQTNAIERRNYRQSGVGERKYAARKGKETRESESEEERKRKREREPEIAGSLTHNASERRDEKIYA